MLSRRFFSARSSPFDERHLSALLRAGRVVDAVKNFSLASKSQRLQLKDVSPRLWQHFISACAACQDARTADKIVELLEPHLTDRTHLLNIRVAAMNAHRRAGNLERVRELSRGLPLAHLQALDVRVRAADGSSDAVLKAIHDAAEELKAVGQTLCMDARLFCSALEACRFDADASDFLWKLAQSERDAVGGWGATAHDVQLVLCGRIVALATFGGEERVDQLVALWQEVAALPVSRQRKVAFGATLTYCARVSNRSVPKLLRVASAAMSAELSPEADVFQASVLSAIRLLCEPQASADVSDVIARLLVRLPSPSELTIKPDLVVLNCVVTLLVRARRMDDAAAFVDDVFPRYGYEADLYTLNTLLGGWVELGDVQRVLGVHTTIVERQLRPTLHTFILMYRACSQLTAKTTDGAAELLAKVDALRGTQFSDSMAVMNARLNVLVRLGHFEAADAQLAEMRAAALPLDMFTFNTLLWGVAQQFKRLYVRAPDSSGGTPPLPEPDQLADIERRVRAILSHMSTLGLQPNHVTFTTLIDMSQDADKCRAIYERMQAQGLRPDKVTLTVLARACVRVVWSQPLVNLMLDECRKYHYKLESPLLRLLLKRALQSDHFDEALALLDRLSAEQAFSVTTGEGQLMLDFALCALENGASQDAVLRLIDERFAHVRISRMQLVLFREALDAAGLPQRERLDAHLASIVKHNSRDIQPHRTEDD